MADINLIPEEERRSESFDKIKGKVTLVSVVVLILTAIAAFVTLAFFGYLINQREDHLARVKSAVVEVDSYKDTEELLVVTKDKAASALSILNSSRDKVVLLSEFARLIPQDVYFTDVNITVQDMTLTGRARTSADVAGLVSSLLSSEGSKIVSNVQLGSLSSDSTGIYQFSLTASLQ